MATIDYNKHIWEGWTVKNFIDDLEIILPFHKDKLKNKQDVKKWCMYNQPYYKKYIPDVVNHFCKQLNIN